MLQELHATISDQYIVILSGELDFTQAEETGKMLQKAVIDYSLVIVDMAQLTFMDCAGARAIETARIAARARRGTLLAVSPRGIPRRLMELLGMPFQCDPA